MAENHMDKMVNNRNVDIKGSEIPAKIRIHLDEIAQKLWMRPSHACALVGAGFSINALKSDESIPTSPTWAQLADKMLEDIPYVLESRKNALEKIKTSDPVDIYMGLWGIGFYDIYEALDLIISLTCGEDKKPFEAKEIHLLTIGYFCMELEHSEAVVRTALAKFPV